MDIAILSNGNAESALDLAFAAGDSITDILKSGDVRAVFETDLYDEELVRDLVVKKAIPCTGDSDNYIDTNVREGIGYWYINLDFKVS